MVSGEACECLADELASVVGVDLVWSTVAEEDLVADRVGHAVSGAGVETREFDPQGVEVDHSENFDTGGVVADRVEVHAPAAARLARLLGAVHAVHLVPLGLGQLAGRALKVPLLAVLSTLRPEVVLVQHVVGLPVGHVADRFVKPCEERFSARLRDADPGDPVFAGVEV